MTRQARYRKWELFVYELFKETILNSLRIETKQHQWRFKQLNIVYFFAYMSVLFSFCVTFERTTCMLILFWSIKIVSKVSCKPYWCTMYISIKVNLKFPLVNKHKNHYMSKLHTCQQNALKFCQLFITFINPNPALEDLHMQVTPETYPYFKKTVVRNLDFKIKLSNNFYCNKKSKCLN